MLIFNRQDAGADFDTVHLTQGYRSGRQQVTFVGHLGTPRQLGEALVPQHGDLLDVGVDERAPAGTTRVLQNVDLHATSSFADPAETHHARHPIRGIQRAFAAPTLSAVSRAIGADELRRFTAAPVARLATVSTDEIPHLVPVVFAVDLDPDAAAAVIYTAVDGKPKSTQRLRRLANIEHNPRVSLLVDHYADDWAQLWWVRADGTATVHVDGAVAEAGRALLRGKYPQYQSVPLAGPVIAIEVQHWAAWSYT